MTRNMMIALGAGAVLLLGAAAAASMYVNEGNVDSKKSAAVSTTSRETVTYTQQRPAPQPTCDDDNIVGKVVGGAAGGLAGSQIGSGSGKTAATIGGAVGGTLLGEEYIPTKNVTCR